MKKFIAATISVLAIGVLTSCGGNSNGPSGAGNANSAASAGSGNAVSGASIYNRTCIACHQANGQGVPNTFPPLAKSDYLADRQQTISQVINGKNGELVVNGEKYNNAMPPQPLNDEEIAAVLTYVYANFGNSGAPVTVDEVKAVRAKAQ